MADCVTCGSMRVTNVCILSAFSFTALVSVISRLYARKIQKIRLELNDHLCIIGLVFTLGLTVFTMHDAMHPIINPANTGIDLGKKTLIAGQLLWVTSVTFIRASVLSLYIRIFRTPSFLATCYVVQGINMAYYVAVVLGCFLICQPFVFLWDRSINGSCGDQKSFDLFIAVINLLMDVTTVVLPMPVIWGLHTQTKKKLVVAGMFSIGAAICAITIVRIKITTGIDGQNTSQQYAKIALFTCLEALLGIINACLPVLKPIFTKLGATGIFSSIWTKTPSATSAKSINTPQSNPTDHLSHGGEKYPCISPPREIVHKDSLHMFSPELPTDARAPSIPLPSFSWQPLSKFYLPRAEWEHGPPELRKDNQVDITTWDVGRRPSEGDSPTLPWRPQWHKHHNIQIDRK